MMYLYEVSQAMVDKKKSDHAKTQETNTMAKTKVKASPVAAVSSGAVTQETLNSSLEHMVEKMKVEIKKEMVSLRKSIDDDREKDEDKNDASRGGWMGAFNSLHMSFIEFTGAGGHEPESVPGRLYQATWSFVVLIVVASYTGKWPKRCWRPTVDLSLLCTQPRI
jgi:hypothetical protein